ncbi:MAG: spermidine synthase [Thermoproteota archaeon]
MSGSSKIRYLTPDYLNNYFLFKVNKILVSERTRFQTLELLKSPDFGLCLALDGLVQLAEYDEYRYHEVLVHPALLNAENPSRVAILGGGDGCALREALKHRSVKRVDLVDLDRRVIEVSKKYLPEINENSLSNHKARIFFTDARKFISRKRNAYDSIIIDLTDPTEGGPSILLYSKEFYRIVYDALRSGGSFVTQATTLQSSQFHRIFWTVRKVFGNAVPLHVYVKSFCDDWGFVMGLKYKNGPRLPPDDAGRVEKEIQERITRSLRYLNGRTYLASFAIPPEEERILMEPVEEITDREAFRKKALSIEEYPDIKWAFK